MSKLSRLHRLEIKAVDLLIISVVLLLITTSAISSGNFALLSVNFISLILVVFVTYAAIVLIVRLLLGALQIVGDGMIQRFAKTAISGLLIFLLFPYVLTFIMWLLGITLTADTQLYLYAASIIRTVVRSLLGRHWKKTP